MSDTDTARAFLRSGVFVTMPTKRKLSRVHQAHADAAAYHLSEMGASSAHGMFKADQSLGDQMQAVAQAVYQASSGASDYCCIEEVFDAYVIIEAGGTYYRADYTLGADGSVTLAARDSWVEVEEVWTPVANTGKAGLLNVDASDIAPYASMKAVGDRLLEVKVAYYGHKAGKDSHNEYFSPNTDFDPENFPAPPLLYYHGFDANGKKMGKPAVTGKFQSRRVGSDGHYLTYKLKSTKYADAQWDAAQAQKCVVSPGTIGHLIRKDQGTGELLYWPLAEISAWDYAANRAPANLHSVAAPVLKALYISEGLTPPTVIETAASDHSPEAGGEPAGDPGAVDLTSEQAAQIIATQVASALLSKNMRNT